jgi:hypothetical protein
MITLFTELEIQNKVGEIAYNIKKDTTINLPCLYAF